ncbi:hypothetical protein GCM10027431_17230 [Lysobacter rhizosphaerae]
MSGRVLPFGGSAHLEAQRLLPWWVNGTLEASEFERMSHHLDECAQCRREVEELQQLRETYAQAAPAMPAPSFARLRRRVQASDKSPAPLQWRDWHRAWPQMPLWLRGLVVAQGLGILVLGGTLLMSMVPDPGVQRDGPAVYHALGATDALPVDAQSRQLVVVFEPAMSQERMRALLRANGARIIDGPNEAGAYVLAIPAARVASAHAALRATQGVVLVEPLDAAAGR